MPKPAAKLHLSLWLPIGLVLAAAVAWDWYSALPPEVMNNAKFVGGSTCAECHQKQQGLWRGSDHSRAMEIASEETVLGDFNDTTFARLGVTTRFFRRDGKFLVNTEGPDGEYRDYEIKYTFGVDPMQQYMVELDRGHVQVLRVSWDTVKKEWFEVTPPDVPNERIEPGDPLHWTGIAQNWNTTCADCHSTNVHKGYNPATDTYHTTYEEINVSCEECHGPGSVHVELARGWSLFWDRHVGYGLVSLGGADTHLQLERRTRRQSTVDARPLDGVRPHVQLEMCAKCHARRYQIHEDFRPGKPFMDYYQPVLLNAGLYHADGQIQDEVYEYGSFLQSRMYANRVRCTDCHDPHSLQRKFVGNKMCGQCHLPGKYDTPAHHHHKPESTGAQCVECHMAARYYMVIDKRRDHSFRIPRPDLSVELGTPNACNDCHTKPEESAQWAADAVRTWYGNKRRNDPHWAPAIAAGRQIQPEGEDLLLDAIRRKTTPNIVRATAFDLLSGYSSSASSGARRKALTNADPLIRGTAIRVLADQNLQGYETDLAERLLDPIRDVRISAAVRLAYLPPDRLEFTDREPLRRAILEFRASQELALDHAGAHLTLAGLDRHNRRIQEAVAHLHSAIQLEPYLSGARTELASILDEHRGDKQQIRTLREEETKLLERDTQLAPGQAEIYYQLGLLHYLLGHFDDAALSLEKACELAPMSYDYHMILALLAERRYELSGEKAHLKSAARLLRKLEVIQPGDPRTKGIAERLSATRMAIEARSPGQPSP